MSLRIRIIPLTMGTCALFLIVKLVDVTRGTEALSDQLLISSVEAQSAATPAVPANPPANGAPASSGSATPAKPVAAGTSGAASSAAKPAKPAAGGDAKQPENVVDKKNPAVSSQPGETVDRHFSAVEVELLQNLAKRREELDHWEENIQIKEATLEATEKRIDDKIQQIDAMKKEVSDLLAQYNEKEDAKIRSLVKIYENMKPADAARIFDEVEMPILLLVIDKMSEKKAAPILAAMNPRKAKQVTVELAEARRVNSTVVSNTAAATAPTPAAPGTNPAASPTTNPTK